MRKLLGLPVALAAAGLALTGCELDTASPGTKVIQPGFASLSISSSYLILGRGNRLPSNLAALISQAGGTLTATVPQIGVAAAASGSAAFPAKVAALSGIESVERSEMVQMIDPREPVLGAGGVEESVGQASHGTDETFYNLQWWLTAVHAPEAWDAGYLGTGVRVAIIDGGLNDQHIDLDGSVDVSHSTSFVPGFAFNQDEGLFSHATHVAGILAARDNGLGTIGIAPGATIIGVKVCHGEFSVHFCSPIAIIQGIVYAATPISEGGAGANIINLSLRFPLARSEFPLFISVLSSATTYAYQRGTTVIAIAGNEALDLDHNKDLIMLPAQSTHVITAAATGPVGFAVGYPDGATNFSRPASYTNFGQSVIAFAAPGGDFVLPGSTLCSMPLIPSGSLTRPCWVFDLMLGPASVNADDIYFFGAGTSLAAPVVAGVAALIIEKNGGSMPPAQVEAALLQSADDLGKPGNDNFYGGGFVNALRAVQ